MTRHITSRTSLCVEALSFGYGEKLTIDNISVVFPAGKISIIIGPNGCGKSTLLNNVSGGLSPRSGHVCLGTQSVHALHPRERAKTLSLLPQHNNTPEGISVEELVARGRFPYQRWFSQWQEEDESAVCEALDMVGMSQCRNLLVSTLSGGQRQRAWIGLVLAQQTPILLLDEPTTYLDIGHQLDVLNVCKNLNKTKGTTVVMVLHDLNLAARYADNIVAMKQGKLIAQGEPNCVYTPNNIKKLFSIDSQIITDPLSNTPLVVPVHNG